jgi:hypothetical protein
LEIGISETISSRNNFFTPDRGAILNINYGIDANWTGSDFDYQRLHSHLNYFMQIKSNWVSGFRFEYEQVFGAPPFYLLPSLSMRGVPAARYQGSTTGVIETEQRFDLDGRWSLVGFAGLGKAIMDNQTFDEAELVYNYGAGFRYLIARAFGIRTGIDIAKGPEDFGWYIVFGHNWNR